MKSASKTMYLVGKILNIIAIILFIIFAIVCGVAVGNKEELANTGKIVVDGRVITNPEEIAQIYNGLLVFCIISIIVLIIVLIIRGFAVRSLSRRGSQKFPHILMLIIGIVSCDIFYFLGAIFGLVHESNQDDEERY